MFPYEIFDSPLENLGSEIVIWDHMGGFDKNLRNPLLDKLEDYCKVNNTTIVVKHDQFFSDTVKKNYPHLRLTTQYLIRLHNDWAGWFRRYRTHPPIEYKNFICSFNASGHVGRKLLVAILYRFGYFNPEYSSKHTKFTTDSLDGHLQDLVGEDERFYRKFFIGPDSNDFFQKTINFGHSGAYHNHNLYHLEGKITNSFLHIVSETMATSYQPRVTEKFFYSLITRGLFLAYAQPGWHAHLEKYTGFKKYTKLFDYQFDTIQHPVERLVELMCMVSKFSHLTPYEWHDLYLIEKDTIDYNYDWFFSERYVGR